MIGIENQYLLNFSIADKTDFIKEADLINFTLIEEVGNVLPTFALEFKCPDENIIKYLNEGNDLKVTFGKTKDKLMDASFRITRFVPQRAGEQYKIQLIGIFSALKYIAEDKIAIYSDSGIAVIKSIVENYFKTDFNINASEDSQNWIQPNICDKKFINDVWMHSYLSNSFIAVGISSEGKFILKDMKAASKEKFMLGGKEQDYKWKFTPNPQNSNEVYYDGDYAPDDNSGFINHYLGYGKQKYVHTLETGVGANMLEETELLLSLSNTLTRSSDITKRTAPSGIINDNVHVNYWNAYYRNMQHLAVFDSTKLTLSYLNQFLPMKILDLVMFNEKEINQKGATEWYSGKYFIKKIGRSLTNRIFATTIQLCRESFSGIRGNLR